MKDKLKNITNRIADHQEHIDTDELWSAVQPHISATKKRRAIWWWIGAPIVISMAVVAYLATHSTHAGNIRNKLRDTNTAPVLENDPRGDEIAQVNYDERLGLKLGDDSMLQTQPATTSTLKAVSITKDITTAKSITDQKIALEEKLNTAMSGYLPSSEETSANSPRLTLKVDQYKSDDVVDTRQDMSAARGPMPSEFDTNRENGLLIKPLPTIARGISMVKPTIKGPTMTAKPTVKITTPSKQPIALSIGMVAGTNLAVFDFSAESLESDDERLRRESSEECRPGVQTGLRITLTKGKWTTSLSSNWMRMRQRAQFMSKYAVAAAPAVPSTVVYTADGSIVATTDNISGVIRNTSEIRYQDYEMLQVMAGAGYVLLDQSQWQVSTELTMGLQRLHSTSGYVSRATNQESYDIAVDPDQIYSKEVNASIGLGCTVNYAVNRQVALSTVANYHRIPNIMNENYHLRQTSNVLSISAGISFNIQ